MTLTDLDTLRAETMRVLLDPTGQQQIWKYDVVPLKDAVSMALDDQNFDNIDRTITALQQGQRYALIGSGICDHPFSTPQQLIDVLVWLCCEGYLSCYSRRDPK